jgi:coenzyme F420-reducing hydrogenase delta subunit
MRLLEYLGMDAGRVHFVWMGVDERGRIQRELAAFEQILTEMGHSTRFAAEPEKMSAGGSHA